MKRPGKVLSGIATIRVAAILLACATQCIGTASGASAGTPELRVTYQEVRGPSVASAAALLHRLATHERSSIQSSCGTTDASNVRILQELARPGRWVRLEWTCDALDPDAQPATVADVSALEALQAAPVQFLPHHELSGISGTQRVQWADLGAARNVLYEVTHVDIDPEGVSLSGIDDAIRLYISAARAAAGNLRAEAWRLDGHANHSTLMFVWNTRADRERFAAGAKSHRFREQIGPGLGAPYDDRLYRRID
jgi:hypothetical protein